MELVEQDGVVNADKLCIKQALSMPGLWGLGRISLRSGGNRGIYLYDGSYPYCNIRTSPPTAYLIDSGVYLDHNDFGRRATHLWKAEPSWPSGDRCGHGTHVAGTIIGQTYGVAKGAIILSVKVLEGGPHGSCSGTWAGVIAGIEKAYSHAAAAGKIPLSVINMSLGKFSLFLRKRSVNRGLLILVKVGVRIMPSIVPYRQ